MKNTYPRTKNGEVTVFRTSYSNEDGFGWDELVLKVGGREIACVWIEINEDQTAEVRVYPPTENYSSTPVIQFGPYTQAQLEEMIANDL